MEFIKKSLNVAATIVPRHSVTVEQDGKRGYVLVMSTVWCCRTKTVEVRAKDAVDTKMNVLKLIDAE